MRKSELDQLLFNAVAEAIGQATLPRRQIRTARPHKATARLSTTIRRGQSPAGRHAHA